MQCHDVRLPQFMEVFAIAKPNFVSSHASTISGREIRRAERINACQKYLIHNCRLSGAELLQFQAFFHARQGSNIAFRFRDYANYQVTGQTIAKGDGKSKKFQLGKSYGDHFSYYKPITRPMKDSVVLYVNGKKSEYEIDYNSGIVTLPKPLEQSQILIGDFIFDVVVRFNSDSFDYTYADDGSILLSEIELLEVAV